MSNESVSYTHLDVYKRQDQGIDRLAAAVDFPDIRRQLCLIYLNILRQPGLIVPPYAGLDHGQMLAQAVRALFISSIWTDMVLYCLF